MTSVRNFFQSPKSAVIAIGVNSSLRNLSTAGHVGYSALA
jgi:hypothetical protein